MFRNLIYQEAVGDVARPMARMRASTELDSAFEGFECFYSLSYLKYSHIANKITLIKKWNRDQRMTTRLI